MNTRQNVPIGNDEQPVVRGVRPVPGEGPAAGTRLTRRDALTMPPDGVGAAAIARPDSIPGTTRRAVTRVDHTDGRPGLPRRNETVIGMDVDRERTLEPMDIEGLGMGVDMGMNVGMGMGAHDADGGAGEEGAGAAAGVWNVHGATAFGL
jgi:hypothetical protein